MCLIFRKLLVLYATVVEVLMKSPKKTQDLEAVEQEKKNGKV